MSKASLFFQSMFVALITQTVVFAAPVSAESLPTMHPCRTIAQACRSEGYSNGGLRSSGQGLVKDCLEKVVAGQSLAGVIVPFDVVSSCNAQWKSRKHVYADRQIGERGGRRPANINP